MPFHKAVHAEIVSRIAPPQFYQEWNTGRSGTIVTTEHSRFQTSPEGGVGALLLLRARSLVSHTAPVLLLHGSTLPGSLAFSARFDGLSWMDDLASRGFDVWTVDIRGYGGSWKPLDDGSRPCAPVADTAQAVEDIARAVTFIRAETGAEAVDLVGWSWGATSAAAYAARGLPLRRLVLHAPQWLRDTPSPMVNDQSMNEPYRTVDQTQFVARWRDRVAQADSEPAGWAEDLSQALADYPEQPLTVPNGSARDIARQWMAGDPAYSPNDIRVPTLVIVGAADTDTPPALAHTVWSGLGTTEAVFREVPHGTHFTVFEPARARLFSEVATFLASQPGQSHSQGEPQ